MTSHLKPSPVGEGAEGTIANRAPQKVVTSISAVAILDSPELHAALDHLYDIFAGYPLRKRVEGCSHCVYEGDILGLQSAPLRLLEMDAVRKYAWKAMTTWGDVNDFKHFLPRLFELAVYDDYGYGLDFLFGKLAYGKFATWPAAERAAFQAFWLAWWQAYVAVYPNIETSVTFFRLGAPYLDDALPLLGILDTPTTLAVQCHLAAFCADLGQCGIGYPPTWTEAPHIARQVLDWFLDEPLLRTLEQVLATLKAHNLIDKSDWQYIWLSDTVADLLGRSSYYNVVP